MAYEIYNYPYFEDYQLFIPWYALPGAGATQTRSRTITWGADTQLVSAKIRMKIWVQWQCTAGIHFNGEQLLFADATLGDALVENTVDVSALLINGKNEVSVHLTKNYPGLDKSGVYSADLILEFTGTPPDITPPVEPMDPIIIAGIVVGGILGALGVAWLLTR